MSFKIENEINNSIHNFIESDESKDKAKTEVLEFDLTQIPLESLIRVGKVFKEGERKYGKDNWLKGVQDVGYQLERANHALRHLLVYIESLRYGNKLVEDDLAKVMWFCCTQIEIEKIEGIIERGGYEVSNK